MRILLTILTCSPYHLCWQECDHGFVEYDYASIAAAGGVSKRVRARPGGAPPPRAFVSAVAAGEAGADFPPLTSADAGCEMYYTSGTTGRPKGAVIALSRTILCVRARRPHNNLLRNPDYRYISCESFSQFDSLLQPYLRTPSTPSLTHATSSSQLKALCSHTVTLSCTPSVACWSTVSRLRTSGGILLQCFI